MAAPGAGVDFAAVAAALEDPLGSTQDALAACDRILLLGGDFASRTGISLRAA